jgi:hypothetical protein
MVQKNMINIFGNKEEYRSDTVLLSVCLSLHVASMTEQGMRSNGITIHVTTYTCHESRKKMFKFRNKRRLCETLSNLLCFDECRVSILSEGIEDKNIESTMP